ncbi:hypothetical protein D3C74_228800 [compost metagenome]
MLPKFGTCSTSDQDSGTITATFPDREDFVTGDLPVIFAPGALSDKVPQPGDEVFVIMFDRTKGVCLGVTSEYINKEGDREMVGDLKINGNVIVTGSPEETGNIKAVGKVTASNI